MPVTPHCTHNLFQDQKYLYQLLWHCQQTAIEKHHAQILSFCSEIDSIDPLTVLQVIANPSQLSFYFEKKSKHQAIAAFGATVQAQFTGAERFTLARNFIHTCLRNTTQINSAKLPFSGIHFFCSFTFFDHVSTGASAFPPATLFLPRWQIAQCQERGIAVANLLIDVDTELNVLLEQICHEFKAITAVKYQIPLVPPQQPPFLNQALLSPPKALKSTILSALNRIEQQQFRKIVLAHAIDINAPLPFHVPYSLHNLRRRYPDCVVFAIGNGHGQTFMGASPECLVRLSNRELMADALAGSAPRGQTPREDEQFAQALLTSPKELWEHQLVVEFITQRLTELGLRPYQLTSPQILRLSNIQHLQTPIRATVPTQLHLLDILAQLHPTPAVAGDPRTITCDYIQRYEPFERSLYAAPIGWLDAQGNGEFVVGIRSALIDRCQARLFAGAGIVAGSNPDRELAEIQLKLQALLAALT